MAMQQGGLESFGADNLNGPTLNSTSRANTANTSNRPRMMHPALSRSKAASRARSQLGDAVDPQVEYIPALKLE